MGSFVYRLELRDGKPADPPTFRTAVPTWRRGDTIPLGNELFAWLRSATTTQINVRRWLLKHASLRSGAGRHGFGVQG